jgi:hypothetical protein
MEATKDNLFEGAAVKYKKETDVYFVIKLNDKSVYISKEKDFIEEFKKRINKKITFKKFCELKGVKKTTFSNIKISEEEANKKEKTVAITKIKKKQKQYLKGNSKKAFFNIWKKIQRQYEGKKHTSIRHINTIGTTRFVVLDYDFEKGMALIKVNDKYVIYNINNDIYFDFDIKKDRINAKTIWPKVTF